MILRHLLILLFAGLIGNSALASHIMGGEITWVCLGGGQYQFDLVLYRDCNGLDIIDPSIDIEVWGHPTVSTITCNLFSQVDLSPQCTEVPAGPPELSCGVGTGGGTGPGAVEKFIYRSAAVSLPGVPPAGGWAFTYDSFSRNWDLTNLVSPATYGITLWSRMYAIDGASASPCTDSSPQFAQDPYMLLCAGADFTYDPNAHDPNNDSLVYSWGVPYDQFPSGTFNPPTNPVPVPFETGFSYTNPTPDATFNPSNVPASMDPLTGEISFTSYTTGNFGLVQKIDSYRDGNLIATVNREIQMIVIPCPGYVNTAPDVTPPFAAGTAWEAEFFAGDLINFDIDIIDAELLQDGTPQTVTMEPSGSYFGTGFVDDMSGCDYTPCATLSTGPIFSGVGGLSRNFNWQTSCDHLKDASGVQQSKQVYTFVLNVQDDYCSVPGRVYETIKITLKNKEPVPAADLKCLDVLSNGDVIMTWNPVSDPSGSFTLYELYTIEDGLIGTVPTIGTGTFTHLGASCDLGSKHYYVVTKYGCDGDNSAYSDTLETMFLTMTDLADGRISLDWNVMHDPMNSGDNIAQEIWREYPTTVWDYRKSLDYDETYILDTVDVCDAFMNYEIRVDNSYGCTSTSNEPGAVLEDIINPEIPEITYVTIDTTNDQVDISWNVNPSTDTYGYIVYKLVGGFWIEYDTIWGRLNTDYTDVMHTADVAPETYRVSAFDSCETVTGEYQTSALSPQHSTIHAEVEYDICAKSNTIAWTPYEGWYTGVDQYEVLVSIAGSPFEVIKVITSAVFSYTHTGLSYDATYVYFVRAISTTGEVSYSNRLTQFTTRPAQPNFHYLSAASFNLGDGVEVKLYTDGGAAVESYEVERKGTYDEDFVSVYEIPFAGVDDYLYEDYDIVTEYGPYQYKINLIDTCGQISETSNIARTIYLTAITDDVKMLNTLNWTAYSGFDGPIVRYDIYRGVNGVFGSSPIGSTLPGVRSYVDDVNAFFDSQGQFCYRVAAVEGTNSYGFSEEAYSNPACVVMEPVVYIPNAFMIYGINSVFLPVLSLYDYSSYDLRIFDRWGGEVFQTADPTEGWDGVNRKEGGLHEEGAYVYQLTIEDRDGKEYVYRGHVTLLIAQR